MPLAKIYFPFKMSVSVAFPAGTPPASPWPESFSISGRAASVPAELFVPQPKVNSAVVRIRMYKEKPFALKDEAVFFRTIKASFEQRRKTLPNSLMTGFPELGKARLGEIIESCGISPTIRGERLTLEDFRKLSDALADALDQ